MKKMILNAMAVLVLSTPAFAYEQVVATCTSAQPSADNTLEVTIERVINLTVGAQPTTQTVASVVQDTVAGQQVIGSYVVEFKGPAPRVLGTTGSYEGNDFAMNLPLALSTDGRRVAYLTATANQGAADGMKINTELFCTIN